MKYNLKRNNQIRQLILLLFINSVLLFYESIYSTHISAAEGRCDVTNETLGKEGKASFSNAACSYLSTPNNDGTIISNQRAYIAEYVKQWDFTYMNICDVFWNFARLLVKIFNELDNGMSSFYKILGSLFDYTDFTTYFDSYNVLIGPIITATLFLYALYVMFFGVQKLSGMKKGVIMFLFICIFGSSVISFIVNASGDLTETAFTSANHCEHMSMGTCIAKNYIIDVPYYASQNNKDGSKNSIDNDYNFDLIHFKDSIGPISGDNGVQKIDEKYKELFGDLNIPTQMDKNGVPIQALGLKDGDWFKTNTDYVSYARYRVNLWGLIPVLLFMTFAIVGTGFVTGQDVFNGLIISGLLPILSAVDIGTGEKTAKAFKMLIMIFINIFLYAIVISFYNMFVKYVIHMHIHWIAQLFLIGGASIGLFNLRSLIAKIFGIERHQESNILQRMYYSSRMFGIEKRDVHNIQKRVPGALPFSTKEVVLENASKLKNDYKQKSSGFKEKRRNFTNRNWMNYKRDTSSHESKKGAVEHLKCEREILMPQEELTDRTQITATVHFTNDEPDTLESFESEQVQNWVNQSKQEKRAPIQNVGGYTFNMKK